MSDEIQKKEIDNMLACCIALLGYADSGKKFVHSVLANVRNEWDVGRFYPMPDGLYSFSLTSAVGILRTTGFIVEDPCQVRLNDKPKRDVINYVADEYLKNPEVVVDFSRSIGIEISDLLN